VFAKTGTIGGDDLLNGRVVVQAKALGGYFQQADGGWHVFYVVVNDAGGGPTVQPAFDAGYDIGDISALLWADANP
jgi:D-alanyl-D-alanine carboxypeptidase